MVLQEVRYRLMVGLESIFTSELDLVDGPDAGCRQFDQVPVWISEIKLLSSSFPDSTMFDDHSLLL